MATIETIQVKAKTPKGFRVINKSEYDPKTMELYHTAPEDPGESDDQIADEIVKLVDELQTMGVEVDIDNLMDVEIPDARTDGSIKRLRGKYRGLLTKANKE